MLFSTRLSFADAHGKLLQLRAVRSQGYVHGQLAVDWAVAMMCGGMFTPNLVILAGLSKPLDEFEVEQYLRLALDEVGLGRPGPAVAASDYAVEVVRRVADGRIDPREGMAELFELAPSTMFEGDLRRFVCVGEDRTWDAWELGDDATVDVRRLAVELLLTLDPPKPIQYAPSHGDPYRGMPDDRTRTPDAYCDEPVESARPAVYVPSILLIVAITGLVGLYGWFLTGLSLITAIMTAGTLACLVSDRQDRLRQRAMRPLG